MGIFSTLPMKGPMVSPWAPQPGRGVPGQTQPLQPQPFQPSGGMKIQTQGAQVGGGLVIRPNDPNMPSTPAVGSNLTDQEQLQKGWEGQLYPQQPNLNDPYNGGLEAPENPFIVGAGSWTPEPSQSQYFLKPQDPSKMENFSMWKNLSQTPGLTKYGQQAVDQINQNRQKQVGAIGQQAAGAFGKATTGLQMRGGMNASQQGVLGRGADLQQMFAKQNAYSTSKNSLLDALKADAELKQHAGEKWASAEQDYNQQLQDAAFRRYQLDLSKWAARVGSDAFKTITGR